MGGSLESRAREPKRVAKPRGNWVAGGFYGWLIGKPGTRAKMSGEAAGKLGEGNEKPPAQIRGIFE